jgi:Transposase DDE domain
MRVRRQTVEHPFGTIKAWMGATHFQMRRLTKVASEMALHVLAYNMKRVMQILGVCGLMAAMRAYKRTTIAAPTPPHSSNLSG